MGHVTLVDDEAADCENLLARARELRDDLTFE
jgi:hypothetical protein